MLTHGHWTRSRGAGHANLRASVGSTDASTSLPARVGVGSTEASASLPARVGVVGPRRIGTGIARGMGCSLRWLERLRGEPGAYQTPSQTAHLSRRNIPVLVSRSGLFRSQPLV